MKEILELNLDDIKIAINYWLKSTRKQELVEELVEVVWNLDSGLQEPRLTVEVKPVTIYDDRHGM